MSDTLESSTLSSTSEDTGNKFAKLKDVKKVVDRTNELKSDLANRTYNIIESNITALDGAKVNMKSNIIEYVETKKYKCFDFDFKNYDHLYVDGKYDPYNILMYIIGRDDTGKSIVNSGFRKVDLYSDIYESFKDIISVLLTASYWSITFALSTSEKTSDNVDLDSIYDYKVHFISNSPYEKEIIKLNSLKNNFESFKENIGSDISYSISSDTDIVNDANTIFTASNKLWLINVDKPIKADFVVKNIKLNTRVNCTGKLYFTEYKDNCFVVYDTIDFSIDNADRKVYQTIDLQNIKVEKETYIFVSTNVSECFGCTKESSHNLVTTVNEDDLNTLSTKNIKGYELNYIIEVNRKINFNDVDERIKNLETKSNRMVIVSSDGTGDYTSVADAVEKEKSNTTIIVKPGIYTGTIRAFNKRVNIIGTDREKCILRQTSGLYANPAMECCAGYLENLTFESKYISGESEELDSNTTGSYAVHCEVVSGNQDIAIGDSLTFVNCNLKSDFFPALGCGSFKDWSLNLFNCRLTNNQPLGRSTYTNVGSLGALYFHDMNGQKGTANIRVKDCIIENTQLANTICPYDLQQDGANIICEFINNTIYSAVNGFDDSVWWKGTESAWSNNFHLSPLSHGNTGDVFNN